MCRCDYRARALPECDGGVHPAAQRVEDLLKRLRERGQDDEATILRVDCWSAQQEIRTAEASGVYDLKVVNEDNGVEKTVEIVRKAIKRFRDDSQNPLF